VRLAGIVPEGAAQLGDATSKADAQLTLRRVARKLHAAKRCAVLIRQLERAFSD
jgi:hypothetical protein